MPTNDDLDELEALGWDTLDEHVPAPAEHAPRKHARRTGVGLMISERDRPETWIASTNPLPVKP